MATLILVFLDDKVSERMVLLFELEVVAGVAAVEPGQQALGLVVCLVVSFLGCPLLLGDISEVYVVLRLHVVCVPQLEQVVLN